MIPQEILWIPLVPLVSALFLLGFSGRLSARATAAVACGAPLLSFLMGLSGLRAVSSRGALAHSYGEWFGAGGFAVDWGFRLDALSAAMVLVVTGVGFLIHVYATGYMRGDAGFGRFFGYLNLFVAAMLALVTADSLAVLFLGWEGVGLCSYLLIGFWHEKAPNAAAGLKAFLVNKVADAAFLAGLLTVAFSYGTLSISELHSLAALGASEGAEPAPPALLTVGLGLLLAGACGKSAQIFLHVWLPDAMAGPTPVSALIHAATMVTAGVYLVARLHFLFLLSPAVMDAMAAIGTVTALYAGLLALFQSDIKRVLAYSTVSQLGFLFLGLGSGAFTASIWHLVTHAFFKALLFLSAGSVIHALHGEQDIRSMGAGLWRRIPATFALATIGVLSVTVWPFAGFQSKHAILEAAAGMPLLGPLAQGAALLTTLYLARWWVLVFFAPRIGEAEAHATPPHESPQAMLAPMAILAAGALVGGRLGDRGASLSLVRLLETGIPAWRPPGEAAASHAGVPFLGLLLFPAAAAGAALLYARGTGAAGRWERERAPALATDAIDWIYTQGIVRPLREGSLLLWAFLDFLLIDGIVNLCALAAGAAGSLSRRIQTGRASSGLWITIASACAIALWLAWVAR